MATQSRTQSRPFAERAVDFARSLVATKRPEPSYPTLPGVSDGGESNIAGLMLCGEVAGTPLIKLGLNSGVDAVERVHKELGTSAGEGDSLDLLIVGAGAAGLGAALRAKELGLRALTIESNRVAMTVVNMYKGKLLLAEPEGMPNRSSMWFEECTREELLDRWRAQIDEFDLDIKEHEKVTDIQKRGTVFEVVTDRGSYSAKRVLLAVGKAGNPRKAGVPGETEYAERIHHNLSDPAAIVDKKILVYGGGDVATEAAIALSERNTVTMVTLDQELIYPKKRNKDELLRLRDAGALDLHMASKLVEVADGTVRFADGQGNKHTLDNDLVFEMIGAELPLAFFKRVGIRMEDSWNVGRWIGLVLVFIGVYSLYALKKFPEEPYAWPFTLFVPEAGFKEAIAAAFAVGFFPFKAFFSDEAYSAMLTTTWFQQGYLYSLAYTVLMIGFGYQAFIRWSKIARDGSYQKWRYLSLIAFQLGFFLIANVVAVQGLSIQHSWRAWGLYQPWPLFFNTFHWWNESDPQAVIIAFVGAGLFGTLVAIPWASRSHGKRFCTWVCGCGGLAETVGDRWRHLAAKGKRSRAWEFQGAVILVAALIVTLVTVGMFGTRADNAWAASYSYLVDFWLVAVIPIALYPFFGGKVWCRYWCPLAAWNQILAAWYGRLGISSNDKCISCTQCSKYCQVGVDVMAFAKNQERFDNANSACIHCGICVDVCPMDVLSFDLKQGRVTIDASHNHEAR